MKIMLAVFQIRKKGGKERDCLALAQFLAHRGHEVTVVTTSAESASSLPFKLTILPKSNFTNHARASAFARAVGELNASTKPDAFMAFEKIPGADFYYAADTVTASSLDFRSWLPRRRTFLALERGVFGKSSRSRVFFLTARQRDEYIAAYDFDPSRSVVLPLILHDDRYQAVLDHPQRIQIREQLGLPRQATVAISVAVQAKQKGVDRTLAALTAYPQLHLLIVGSSDKWLTRRIQKLRLEDRVRVVPYASNVMHLMLAADFLVHPARIEAAGQVISEALLAGCPAIVSAICGYASEVTRSDAGIVLPEPFRPETLVDAISIMMKHLPTLRRAAADASTRQRECRGHWLTVIAEEVERFYFER